MNPLPGQNMVHLLRRPLIDNRKWNRPTGCPRGNSFDLSLINLGTMFVVGSVD